MRISDWSSDVCSSDLPHENELVFKLLVNKNSIRSIARVADLSPKAVYGKIDFIHRQCLAFAADRERDLQNLPLRRLFISTDRQDYQVNWTDRKNNGNVQRSEEQTSELQSLMRISYAVFCLKKQNKR